MSLSICFRLDGGGLCCQHSRVLLFEVGSPRGKSGGQRTSNEQRAMRIMGCDDEQIGQFGQGSVVSLELPLLALSVEGSGGVESSWEESCRGLLRAAFRTALNLKLTGLPSVSLQIDSKLVRKGISS